MQRKRNVVAAILIVLLIDVGSNCAFAQSQTAMNIKAGDGFEQADKELNMVYQKILKSYTAQPKFIAKLKVAQRLWVQLRDAELAARYPDSGSYGSVAPMCESMYMESLTRERIKFLKVWLTGIPEGDVCNGSVKSK